MRYLLLAIVIVGTVGCTVSAESLHQGEAPHWVILGDRDLAPDAATLAALAEALPPDRPRPVVTDLSTPGAGLEAVVRDQLPERLNTKADLTLLRLGGTDLAGATPLSSERFGDLLSALLRTLDEREGMLIVSTIPAVPRAVPATGRLDEARRLRRIEQANNALRRTVRDHRALVADVAAARGGDARARALTAWTAPLNATLGVPAAPGQASALSIGDDWLSGLDGDALGPLRARATAAHAAGQRLDVVAKIGDSITAAPAFLAGIGASGSSLGIYSGLADTIDYFTHTPLTGGLDPAIAAGRTTTDTDWVGLLTGDGLLSVDLGLTATSFTRQSLAARARWGAADVVAGGAGSALGRELAALRPGVAIVMFGTNDLTRASVEEFEASMAGLLETLEGARVIPMLTTIPQRTDREDYGRLVPDFNAAIRALAAAYGLPLIDYGAMMERLPNGGLADGLHPNVCPDGAGSLTQECLRYGYNLRNLMTLQALDLLRVRVLNATSVPVVSRASSH